MLTSRGRHDIVHLMARARNTSGQQDGSPDLFSELPYSTEELRATVISYLDRCLAVAVSEDDVDTALRDIGATDDQCRQITEVIKGSHFDMASLSQQTDDAEIAFLILRLFLSCVF
jgi:hypothetical protein